MRCFHDVRAAIITRELQTRNSKLETRNLIAAIGNWQCCDATIAAKRKLKKG